LRILPTVYPISPQNREQIVAVANIVSPKTTHILVVTCSTIIRHLLVSYRKRYGHSEAHRSVPLLT